MKRRPFSDMRPTGLLWLLNRTVFHPRGYALALHFDDVDAEPTGWSILGDGSEPWNYDPAVPEDDAFVAVEALFASLRSEATPSDQGQVTA